MHSTGAPNGIFRSNICSDGRLPKNFEIFFPVDTLDLSNFSENHKDSLEFSELMYSLLSCSIIFGRFSLFPKNFVWRNSVPKTAKSFGGH